MRILLLNPPHPSIGSRIPHDHLPPLGLLCIGGPLVDDGHDVYVLNADLKNESTPKIIASVQAFKPDVVLVGHSGSTSAHPATVKITRGIRENLPNVKIVYGGVFPTYHWREILDQEAQIDIIVRGEGEETSRRLMQALENGLPLRSVNGLAFRENNQPISTPRAAMILNLDDYRVGWELIDLTQYTYWGGKRAVVVQFSRGCPHLCNYCGQRGFWTRWRHRNPRKFAAELAWLHREHGVEVINFADENPTASREAWQEFLEALIAENVPLTLVGSTRADAIVRDADILHLYKKAGVSRWLMGIENYNKATLENIRKGGSVEKDQQAIQLLRLHGIISMATYVVGFEQETIKDYFHSLRNLLCYDPDQVQLLFVTPHRWTEMAVALGNRKVIQTDQTRWDYKHQVLENPRMSSWKTLLCTKLMEAAMQLRPRALWRVLRHPERDFREAMRWYYGIGRRVWFHEIWGYLWREKRTNAGPTLQEFWGESSDDFEEALEVAREKR